MNSQEFKKIGYEFIDWMADYLDEVENLPVKPDLEPGDIFKLLPDSAPDEGEPISEIFSDFKKLILPGMTHWQSPSFHAYFPGNNSKPSILAEMLTATMGAQCMLWATSPAATELEDRVMVWLRKMVGLSDSWVGSIQSGASDATLNAILTAREKASNFATNNTGILNNNHKIYTSEQVHSSADKAIAIAGIGKNNLVKIATDNNYALRVDALEDSIKVDIANGNQPLMIIVAIGTTGSTAIDPLSEIVEIARKYAIWVHVDAALAGTALLLENMRWMVKGIEQADSFVFNPHKWMFTNFDASAYFVKDKAALIKTFSVSPEYLRTKEDELVNNYRDWGVPLGRRFRALKLWFVIRNYGVDGLKEKIAKHLQLAQWFKDQVETDARFELLAPVPLNTICFRTIGATQTLEEINLKNELLMHRLNKSGKIFLTHVKLRGIFALRMVIGQTEVELRHIKKAWHLIQQEI